MDQLVIVDQNDKKLGFESKEKCHNSCGILHRAFSVFVFNDKKQLLIQQRSELKRLWPLYWSNTCCSHPRQDEAYEEAAERRIKEEIGISCELEYLYKFQYKAKYKNIGSENEICAVLTGSSNDEPSPDPDEIADYKWVDMDELVEDIKKNPEKFTPWFKDEIKELLCSFSNKF